MWCKTSVFVKCRNITVDLWYTLYTLNFCQPIYTHVFPLDNRRFLTYKIKLSLKSYLDVVQIPWFNYYKKFYSHGNILFTAHNEFGARLCFTCVYDSVHREGVVSQHALQVVSENSLQQVSRAVVVSQHALQVSRPTPRGGGELRGLARGVSRPTPWGRGSGVSRPTLGESPGPHPEGVNHGMHWSRPPPMATVAGGTHPTGMHSCVWLNN